MKLNSKTVEMSVYEIQQIRGHLEVLSKLYDVENNIITFDCFVKNILKSKDLNDVNRDLKMLIADINIMLSNDDEKQLRRLSLTEKLNLNLTSIEGNRDANESDFDCYGCFHTKEIVR